MIIATCITGEVPTINNVTDPQTDPQVSLQVRELLKVMGNGVYFGGMGEL